MATAPATAPLWAYKPKANDPIQIKSVANELLSHVLNKVEYSDSVSPHFTRSLWFDGTSVIETNESTLTVDFQKSQIYLPEVQLSNHVPLKKILNVDNVRYAAFYTADSRQPASDGQQIVIISTWLNDRNMIHNFYFILEIPEALLLVNGVLRLISKQSLGRANVIYPLLYGRVLLSSCDKDRHQHDGNCCKAQKLMYFIADFESLAFFDNEFNNTPIYDFRFYKEQGPKAIDIIMVSKIHGHIQVQQSSCIYVINKSMESEADEETFMKLVKIFRDNVIQSRPEEYFSNPEKFSIRTKATTYESEMPRHSQRNHDFNIYHDDSSSSNVSRWQTVDARYSTPSWLEDLYSGRHTPSEQDELLMWLTFETDIRECIDSGTVPYTSPESGGLDPNSHDHLQRSIEDIKDHLFSQDFSTALSRLRACLAVFGSTLLQPVERLDEVEFMKRIYFLSGRD